MTAFATAGPTWQELIVLLDVPPAEDSTVQREILEERRQDLLDDALAVRVAASVHGWTSQRMHRRAAISEEIAIVTAALRGVGVAGGR